MLLPALNRRGSVLVLCSSLEPPYSGLLGRPWGGELGLDDRFRGPVVPIVGPVLTVPFCTHQHRDPRDERARQGFSPPCARDRFPAVPRAQNRAEHSWPALVGPEGTLSPMGRRPCEATRHTIHGRYFLLNGAEWQDTSDCRGGWRADCGPPQSGRQGRCVQGSTRLRGERRGAGQAQVARG